MKITKRVCEELSKAPVTEARAVHWDEGLRGFGIRVGKDGHIAFLVKYRVKGDPKQRLVTLGSYPGLSAEKARSRAAEIKAEAGLGRDAVAEQMARTAAAAAARKEAERQGVPVGELLDRWREITDQARQAREDRGESSDYERMLLRLESKVLRPAIGHETVKSLDPDRFQAIIDLQTARSVANNLRALIVRFNRFANATMMARGAPTKWPRHLEVSGKARPRTSMFTLDETAKLWIAAGGLGRRGALIRFMLLTACRRIEAQKVEWSHIVLDDPVSGPHWQQPGRLTKNHRPHRVPLSPPATALLRWLPRRAEDAELVFAGRGNRPVGSWALVMRTLREAAGLEAGTLHDFRRTIVSSLGDHGFDPQVADQLLNHSASHSTGGVMGVYQRSELWAKRRDAIDLWCGILMKAVGSQIGRPVCTETWGFDVTFADAKLRKSPDQRSGADRPRRSGSRPSVSAQGSKSPLR